jgi:hypothetical protein
LMSRKSVQQAKVSLEKYLSVWYINIFNTIMHDVAFL